MIYFLSPYYPGDLGKGYNDHIKGKYSPNDWLCVMDMDTCILNNKIPYKLYEYTKQYKDAGILTAYTNRIGGHQTQLFGSELSENYSILYHKEITDELIQFPNQVNIINQPISGFFMLFKYSTFEEVGGFDNGIFVDGKFSEKVLKIGKQILLMQNIYVFHYYRLKEGKQYKEHLKV